MAHLTPLSLRTPCHQDRTNKQTNLEHRDSCYVGDDQMHEHKVITNITQHAADTHDPHSRLAYSTPQEHRHCYCTPTYFADVRRDR